jgi:GT2 family glycosyltransferase
MDHRSPHSAPLVSCVVPVFNGERFIQEALDSILAQTYEHLEVLVVDDGSTDGTAAAVQRYGARVRYLHQENGGPPVARNTGLREARGEFIAFLDSDDRWAPAKTALQLDCFRRNPQLCICLTHVQNFWESELEAEREDLQDHRRSQPLPGYATSALLARRDAFETVGTFDTQFQHGDDFDWFVRARQLGIEMELLPDVLVYRRMHPGNRSRQRVSSSRDEYLKLVKAAIDRKRRDATRTVNDSPQPNTRSPVPGRDSGPKSVFAAMEGAFEEARQGRRERTRRTLHRFGGKLVELRIVGGALAEQITRPLSHLAEDDSVSEAPELRIDLWDEQATGIACWPCKVCDGITSTRPRFTASEDGRFGVYQYRRSMVVFDRVEPRMVGWFARSDQLDLPDLSRPLYAPLLLWHRDRGIRAVHAAAVQRQGLGVLFGGPAGCGKSTAALSCLCQGFSYLGDDYVGLEERKEGAFRGCSLYSSAHVDCEHLKRFPALAAHEIRVSPESKSFVLVPQVFPDRTAATAPMRLLMLPRVSNDLDTRVGPATKGQALMRLAPSSLLWLPHAREAGMDLMARFVEAVPCRWIDLGRNLDTIAPQVERALLEVTA